MPDREECRQRVEEAFGGSATYRETVRVVDTFRGQTAWEGDVHVFDLSGSDAGGEAYAWPEEGKVVAVVKSPPVDGPLAAVRAAIAARHSR